MKIKQIRDKDVTVCVVGLGYVGLPLALAFASKGFRVIGYDVDSGKIENLRKGTNLSEYPDLPDNIKFTSEPASIKNADFIHICVPTLLKDRSEPDMKHIENASRTIGKNLKKGAIVVNESSVYPGATEEVIKPILEDASGMICGRDFKLGFSPERVNPGDKDHDLDRVVKVVSGIDDETVGMLAELYRSIVSAGVFKAKNIKTAEMAKLSENIQRDLNIAMINELSIISKKLGINIVDVLEAAATKWNFCKYYPGLVGGYCVPVNPIYLLYKARKLGYEPKVISAGRELNDSMPEYVANMITEKLGDRLNKTKILVMGLSFKKNVSDARESPAKIVIKKLNDKGADILCYDPLLDRKDVIKEFGIEPLDSIKNLSGINCILVMVAHDIFKDIKLDDLKTISSGHPLIVDIQHLFNKDDAENRGFEYMSL